MDIARLSFEIDSSQVDRAEDDLEKLSRASKDAEKSQRGLASTSTRAGRDVAAANDNIARSGTKASRSLRNGAASAGLFATGLRGATVAASGLVAALSPLLAPLLVLASPLIAIQSFISNTSEAERVTAQLEAAITSTGGAAGRSLQQLQQHASQLQSISTFGDQAISSMQGVLLTFTQIRGDNFNAATEAVLDLSARLGTDLQSAALQVGKALNAPVLGVSALAEAGIQFTEAQKELIKSLVETGDVASAQQIILKELEVQFGGSAEAARNTLGGALGGLSNVFKDLFETVGPVNDLLINAIERLSSAIQNPIFKQFVNLIGQSLFFAFTVVIEVIALTVNTFNTLVSIFQTVGNAAISGVQTILSAFGILPSDLQNIYNLILSSTRTVLNNIIAAFIGTRDAITTAWGILPNVFGDLGIQAANALVSGINRAVSGVKSVLNQIIQPINSIIQGLNSISGGTLNLGTISPFDTSAQSFSQFENPFAGALGQVGDAFTAPFGRDFIGEIFSGSEQSIQPLVTQLEAVNDNLETTVDNSGAAADALKSVGGASPGIKAATDSTRALNAELVETGNSASQAARGFVGDFINGLRRGEGALQSLANAVSNLADRLINEALDAIFRVGNAASGLGGGGGGGILGGILGGIGSLFGFQQGGFTGNRPTSEVSGIVHGQEFVVNAEATRANRALLETINAGGRLVNDNIPTTTQSAQPATVNRSVGRGQMSDNRELVKELRTIRQELAKGMSVTSVIVDDPDRIPQAVTTGAGGRKLLNFLSQNRREFAA